MNIKDLKNLVREVLLEQTREQQYQSILAKIERINSKMEDADEDSEHYRDLLRSKERLELEAERQNPEKFVKDPEILQKLGKDPRFGAFVPKSQVSPSKGDRERKQAADMRAGTPSGREGNKKRAQRIAASNAGDISSSPAPRNPSKKAVPSSEEASSISPSGSSNDPDFYFDASGKRVYTGTTGRGDLGGGRDFAGGYSIRENKNVSLKSTLKELFEQEQATSSESTETSGGRLEKAKALVEKNNILSKFAADLQEKNLVDLNNEYVLLLLDSTFNHAKHSHSAVSDLPGSKFNTVDDNSLLEIMKKIVNSGSPSETENRNGTEILKWFNVDLKTPVGKDSLVSPEEAKNLNPQDYDFYEPIGNKKAIPSILSQGLAVYDSKDPNAKPITAETPIEEEKTYYIKQPLKIVYGPQKETSLVTLILGVIGELEGKKLVTLFTMFPGISVPEFRNKQDYVKAGYAFIKPGNAPAATIQEGFTSARWQRLANIIKD